MAAIALTFDCFDAQTYDIGQSKEARLTLAVVKRPLASVGAAGDPTPQAIADFLGTNA